MDMGGMKETRRPRVVVGVGTGLAGLAALRYAVAEGRRRGALVEAVRAWQFLVPWGGTEAAQLRAEVAAEAAREVVEAFNQTFGGIPVDVPIQLLTHEGPAAAVLLTHASGDDDVLVVGANSRHVGSKWTVDGQCLREASCPVVVVPAPSMARGTNLTGLARELIREADRVVQSVARGFPDGFPAA
jgi:hypothetical protein